MGWITDNVLLAGGGISPTNWQQVVELNISAVVNLRSEHQNVFAEPWPIAYLWLPVADQTEPTVEQLLLGAQFIHANVQANRKVLVHCRMGIHRSATVVRAYLLYTGLSLDDALAKLGENGPRLYGTERELALLNEFSHQLKRG
jgi:protein-tyrosine phosphatase